MRRTILGTRLTTGCGHSWKRRRPKWTRRDLRGASTDCPQCGELLIIPREQFAGQNLDDFPVEVHCPLFHPWLAAATGGLWPSDGRGTGSIEFDAEERD